MDGWINAKDRQPALFERVIAHARGGYIFIGHTATDSGHWQDDDDEWTVAVTHWMPLPPPPVAGAGDESVSGDEG